MEGLQGRRVAVERPGSAGKSQLGQAVQTGWPCSRALQQLELPSGWVGVWTEMFWSVIVCGVCVLVCVEAGDQTSRVFLVFRGRGLHFWG